MARLSRILRKHFSTRLATKRNGKKGRPDGGSEAVTVEPDRPIAGAGGAAVALDFDEERLA
jgi:hypothetical protein